MNVLSLFDGISCGRIALERAGIVVDNYYASEIDKFAIKVSSSNYPDIIQLGDVTKWKDWDIDFSSIDLIMGGSPCQGFSLSGKRLNFDDPRSKLFFIYVDIYNHIKSLNPNVKFLLENVKMANKYKDRISEILGVQPVLIDSALVSAQTRKRYYWANWEFSQPEDKHIYLKDILEEEGECYEVYSFGTKLGDKVDKAYTILARDYKGFCQWRKAMTGILYDDKVRYFYPIELERLQTLPEGYTSCLSKSRCIQVVGNGWTIDVIAHILRELKNQIKS